MDTQRRFGQGKRWQYIPLLAPLTLFVLIPFLCESAFAAAGDLDSSFDSDGIRVVRLAGSNLGQGLGLQSDGKIVVAGYTNAGSTTNNVLVLRLNPNGSLDSTFDGDGIRIVLLAGDDRGQAVAVQSDGKIVVAGYTNSGSTTNNVLALRLNANGSSDTSFDGDGIQIVSQAGDDRGQAVAVQGDKIVVAGYTNTGSRTNNFLAVRLNVDGSLDTSFDLDGVRTIGLSGDDRGRAVAVQTDGHVIIAGDTTTFGLEDFMVVRLNADGSLDTTFDGNGIRTAGLSGKNLGQGVKIQPDGKIIMVGTTDTFDVSDVELMRFLGQ